MGLARFLALVAVAALAAAAQESPHDAYRQLNALRVDLNQVYFVRDLHLRRGEVRLALTEGKIALLQDFQGRLTGAVYTGRGRVLVMVRDVAERRSLARFLDEPLVDQGFSRAYFRFTDDTGEILRRMLAEEGRRLDEPSFTESWDASLANLNPWHSLRILADVYSENPRAYFYAGIVSDKMGMFDVLVDGRRLETVHVGQSRYVEAGRYYDLWTSFSPEGQVPEGPPFESVAFHVETSIQQDASLEGRARVTLKAVTGGERMVALELSRNLRVDSVGDAEGRGLPFFQNEDVSRDEMAQRGNDSVFVVLPAAPKAGEELRLWFTYRGNVIADAGNGVYFVGERGSWYPHIGGTDQFGSFSLVFRWPRHLQLVATGRRVAESEEGEWRTGRWESEGPITVAGFNLSDYAVEVVDAGKKPRIELYANKQLEQALASRFRPRVVDQVRQRDLPGQPKRPPRQDEIQPPVIPPRIIPAPYVPSPAAQMKEMGRDLAGAIEFYEKIHGPFPYERLAITQIPGSFGQGWPGLLYLSTLAFLPPDAQRNVGMGQRSQEHFTELLPYHEVTHQWWGNVAGWRTYRDQWIFEGLAHYLAVLYADSKKPNDRALASWLDRFRSDLMIPAGERGEPIEQVGPLSLGYRLRSADAPGAYANIVYGKGTWVWHMLRTMLRDTRAANPTGNPDARFHTLLRRMLENYRYKGISTGDLRREVEKLMTKEMDLEEDGTMTWFFEQWVKATGIPRYAVRYDVRPRGQGFVVRGTLRQTDVPEVFTAAVPIYATRQGGRPVLLGRVITLGQETAFEFTVPFRPAQLQIDPNLTLLRNVE